MGTGRVRETLYIIRESNVAQETDLIAPTTVWVCVGSDDDYHAGTRVAGPVPVLFADQMVDGLRTLLERLGHTVIVQNASDD